MTPKEKQAADLDHQRWIVSQDQLTTAIEGGRSSPERTRTASEVGAAILHQLNGPLTALRLYVGEIRRNSPKLDDTAEAQDQMLQIVEAAFQETERVCAIMGAIADRFEEPLSPETAAVHGRDVIAWWSRNSEASGCVPEQAIPIRELLTPREWEVLGHISQGLSNKQGAIRLQIGPRTFESHRFRIMRKLGAKNGADLVRMVFAEKSATL